MQGGGGYDGGGCLWGWLLFSWRPNQSSEHAAAAVAPRAQGLKAKDVRFACRDRAALLSVLYRAVEAAVARGASGLGPTLLGCAAGALLLGGELDCCRR